VNIS
jgi:hypothetical protein